MNIPVLPVAGPVPVPEDPKPFIVSVDVIVCADTALAAADRVADLGRRLTQNCDVVGRLAKVVNPELFPMEKEIDSCEVADLLGPLERQLNQFVERIEDRDREENSEIDEARYVALTEELRKRRGGEQ